MRVCVIGGGIIGFTCALRILEEFRSSTTYVEVTIISEKFSPNTTGDGSAGLWGPYLLGDTPTTKVHEWSKETHDFLEKLWLSEDASVAGVCLIPVIRVTTDNNDLNDFWKDIVYGCMPMLQNLLNEYNEHREKKYTYGRHFITYTSEPRNLLPYLMGRFSALGGRIITRKVDKMQNFIETSPYNIIINCTGLGSCVLLNDKNTFPVRGQVSRVKAPWLYNVILDESNDNGNYIIPNMETVILGGTHQENNYDTSISTRDKEMIVDGCRKIVPALTYAQHLYDWVGLRPGRNKLRLEIEHIDGKIIIHNYGHGGSGVTLAWGCAGEVLKLLRTELAKRNLIKSKL